jgi:hypothetical protein
MTSRPLFILFVALSTTALAQDLKPFQEEAKGKFDNQLNKIVKEDVNGACGTAFEGVKTDFQNFKKEDFPRSTAGTLCTTLTYAMGEVCKVPAYKKVMAAKLKGLSCLMGGNATDPKDVKARIYVKDGVFTYKMNADGGGGIEATNILKAFLDQ